MAHINGKEVLFSPQVHITRDTGYYDEYWDTFQDNGERRNYYHAFAYGGSIATSPWTNKNFKPKYPIKPTIVENMCTKFAYEGDITEVATFDFSITQTLYGAFVNCPYITKLGVMDFRGVYDCGGAVVSNCYALHTIDKLIFKPNGTQRMDADGLKFTNCTSLQNIEIEGHINFNINYQWCPLSKKSITSVVNALYDGSTGKTATFKKSAKEAAFTADEWAALIGTKTNWTIALA